MLWKVLSGKRGCKPARVIISVNVKIKILQLKSLLKSVEDEVDTKVTTEELNEAIENIPEPTGGGVEEAPVDGKQYGRKDADWTEVVAGGHTQNTDTNLGTLGTKNPPIDADKVIYRNSASSDALVTSTWTQIKAFLKTYFDGIYATGTIPVKASSAELNTGSDDAKFVTCAALYGSEYLSPDQMGGLTEIDDSGIDTAAQFIILFDSNDALIKKITIGNFKKYLDTLYTPL